LQQPHLVRLGEERGEIIFPQSQEAAGKVRGVGHTTEYTVPLRVKKQRAAVARVFDEAIGAKRCIVAAGDVSRSEPTRT
jgi:hypothetical protein